VDDPGRVLEEREGTPGAALRRRDGNTRADPVEASGVGVPVSCGEPERLHGQANKGTARIQSSSGVPDFRLHDVRRTVATGLATLGTADAVVEAVLGHTAPVLQRTYNLYSPVPEMRAALEAWAARLDRILSGEERLLPERREALCKWAVWLDRIKARVRRDRNKRTG